MFRAQRKKVALVMRIALLTAFTTSAVAQSSIYQSKPDFLAESFGTAEPRSDVIWFDAELRSIATKVLGHPPAMMRLRYWHDGPRTAWIVDEIGKEKPITLGIVIQNGAIQRISVLQFRESRGWEIKYPFFTEQFDGVRLDQNNHLNQRIDGITGATLSVRAATRSANLALVLSEHIKQPSQETLTAP
jgi:hypothetical protein